MSAEDRRAQIIGATDALLSELGYLPLPMATLSQRAGISRALIYARFASQHDLVNAVLLQHFETLRQAGLFEAMAAATLDEAAERSALIYLRHTALHGAALHIGFRESFMAGQIDRGVQRLRDRAFLRLARTARRELRLDVVDTIAAIQMILTIPEEAGRLAFEGELQLDQAMELCTRLLRASIASLRPSEAA